MVGLEFEMQYTPGSRCPLGALLTRLPSYQYHSALSNTSLGNGGGGSDILRPPWPSLVESVDLDGRMAFHVAPSILGVAVQATVLRL